jgi:ABC-type transport system involved in cytochrome c biogenesis ATPase subunit
MALLDSPSPSVHLADSLCPSVHLTHSLSPRAGGQRSLLALSLILALLLFKPAPMYILDEIDAALDLSHTQVREIERVTAILRYIDR